MAGLPLGGDLGPIGFTLGTGLEDGESQRAAFLLRERDAKCEGVPDAVGQRLLRGVDNGAGAGADLRSVGQGPRLGQLFGLLLDVPSGVGGGGGVGQLVRQCEGQGGGGGAFAAVRQIEGQQRGLAGAGGVRSDVDVGGGGAEAECHQGGGAAGSEQGRGAGTHG